MDEEWRPITGWEGLYEVSNLGRVRSHTRQVRRRGGKEVTWKGRILKPNRGSKGHYRVNLVRAGKATMVYIHQVVAQAFVLNPDNLPLVLHWDDVKENNRADNLRWGTHHDNRQDAIRNGRKYGAYQSSKTHCPQGHPYSGDNLYVTPGDGRRYCRACKSQWAKRNQSTEESN